MKLFGFSLTFWILLILFAVFSSYFFKTIWSYIYYTTTGNSLGSSFYNNTKYGQPDYAYALGKAVFRV